MKAGDGLALLQHSVGMIILAFLPLAIATTVVGLMVTLTQSWLHWNDISLSFIPKALVVAVILVFGWWAFVHQFVHWYQSIALGMPEWLQY